MLCAHFIVVIGFWGMGGIALGFGVWESYDGIENVIGLLLQAVIFNCLLLPVALLAIWKWNRYCDNSPTPWHQSRP